MAIDIFSSIFLNSLAMAVAFTLLTFMLSLARLLPLELQLSVSRFFADVSRYIAASQFQIRSEDADPIRIDPINWYGRGNVLYQIGQILTELDVLRQSKRSEKSLSKLDSMFPV